MLARLVNQGKPVILCPVEHLVLVLSTSTPLGGGLFGRRARCVILLLLLPDAAAWAHGRFARAWAPDSAGKSPTPPHLDLFLRAAGSDLDLR